MESRVQYLEQWMQVHLGEPVQLADMAAAVEMSPRGLRDVFKLRRGCTPVEAIQELRLQRARQALLSGDPSLTVTEVAMEYGIFHLGRFARRYRLRFGETPSTTLKRAQDLAVEISRS